MKVNVKYSTDDLFIEASCGNLKILDHHLIDIVKNKEGLTVLEVLAKNYKCFPSYKEGIPHKWVREKYPWFNNLGTKKVITAEKIKEILNTPKSVMFIKEIL